MLIYLLNTLSPQPQQKAFYVNPLSQQNNFNTEKGFLFWMTDFKVTFPKLKSYSQGDPTVFSSKSKTMNTIATEQPRAKQHSISLQERLSNLKYKYVNKSPSYFKHQNLSPSSQRFIYPNQTIEHYIAQQGKMFDKEMLLELARSRVKKNSQLQQSIHKKEQQLQKEKESLDETRYSNFRPLRIPIKHNIKGIRHPDLTLTIRLP